MSKYGNSSYWLKDWEDDDIIADTLTEVEKKSNDLYKLASAKRAISNFVNIVTNDSIPVTFNQRGDSYTDGKSVVIGSNVVEPKDFDIAVGLALHEGSHIKLTDFNHLHDIYNLVPQHIKDGAIKKGITNTISVVKDLWNVIEDRRIDRFVFDSAPGYRDYYRAMYDKYFNDKLIDKALLSDEHTEECVDSYMFRIINLHNKNTDLNALKGLKEIYKIIGLGTINRLKSSLDSFNIALKVFQIIMANLPSSENGEGEGEGDGQGENGENTQSQNGQGDGSSDSREMTDDEFEEFSDQLTGSSPMSGDMDSQPTGGSGMDVDNLPQNMEGGQSSQSDSNDGKEVEKVTLSDRQKELLKKKIEKQKQFMDGDVRKKTVSKKENDNLDAIDESGSEMKSVGGGVQNHWGKITKGTQCIVVKKLTKSLLESDMFPMTQSDWNGGIYNRYEKQVAEGVRIGTILGKKLQVRGEDRSTIFNRQKHGKIDRRMISSLGFGNENVFQYMETDSYKKANLHISIDASGSMSGDKWTKTLTNVVALCKAVDMIQNLSIQVSFRTTSNNSPYIVMAYDSRSDKFSKVKQMFSHLESGGTTPEGLCFEAIMDNFLPANNDMDSYFLNISDGEPYFENGEMYYSGKSAFEHTRKMVKKIEGMGVKTLSYYVEQWIPTNGEPSEGFKTMYGKGAVLVDITNISQITKTMNRLFLSK
jgi:hypothetical protein